MRGVGPNDTDFRATLDQLKRRGSALLVVGDVPEEAYARVSSRMLGDDDHAARKRTLVLGGHLRPALDDRLSGPRAGPQTDVHIVTHGTSARSAVEAATGVADGTPTTHVGGNDVEALGTAVIDAIDELDGEFDPAELRVGFDTLQTLLDDGNEFAAFALVNVLAHRVRNERGMAHFRLPKSRDSYDVRLLEPLFDAVVELRVNGDGIEHRWEVVDDDLSTAWMPFDG